MAEAAPSWPIVYHQATVAMRRTAPTIGCPHMTSAMPSRHRDTSAPICDLIAPSKPTTATNTMMTYMESVAATAGIPADQVAAQPAPTPLLLAATVLSAVTAAPFINMVPAFGEELGWRGMLFPLLCKRMSQRAAVLVSGVIWGLWHAPIIAMGHNYGMGYPGFPIAGILMMVLACIAMGSIMGYLRLRTGSVWPCALAHGAVNATASIGVLFCTAGFTLLGPNMLGLLAGLPMIAVGIVCWLRMPIADQGDA